MRKGSDDSQCSAGDADKGKKEEQKKPALLSEHRYNESSLRRFCVPLRTRNREVQESIL